MAIQVHRRPHLLNDARLQDHDAIRHGHGFHLIMRNIDGGGMQFAMQFYKLQPHAYAERSVEVRKRLVKEKDLWVTDDRTTDSPRGCCKLLKKRSGADSHGAFVGSNPAVPTLSKPL